ncbi:lanthionine synthetase LanC family protein [Streptomyces tateyamensis]|uniref:lanthionine synthetase LanC family protein n=1 Tax=Streptomyces tateyamensis TaxID=565073 RepID=UPI001FEC0379|nr:lanthionine synthetase LanC family protein [Streptomyces tateyamensis]
MDSGELAVRGLDWLLAQARRTPAGGGGLSWPTRPSEREANPVLYSGAAGIVLTLLEAHQHFGANGCAVRYAEAALRAARALAVEPNGWELSSLHFGLTGRAVALRAVAVLLGDTAAGTAADRALAEARARFDGTRWAPQFDLLGGNAGIALGALAAGDPELALLAVTPYLRTAEPTPAGVTWETRAGRPARLHHVAHGTLGVVQALAAVGSATGRPELLELARAGALDVVARAEAGPAGFLVPHSDPQDLPDRNERYSYGWCNGPTGDAEVFQVLGAVSGETDWSALTDRCWHTVTRSGLPRRLRPGFWDNSGHCCGTAGVLAFALDRAVAGTEGAREFAGLLAADLAARATVDAAGARWSNTEHRSVPSALEPATGWAMGSAGIIRELLRHERLVTGRDAGYAFRWPVSGGDASSAALSPSSPR